MREKPEFLANADSSLIAFTPTDFGMMNGRFEAVCLSHGDGDSFKWLAGGGEYNYSIRRIDTGVAKDDGSVCSAWEFIQTDQTGHTDVLYINVPELEITDILGE